MQSVAQLLSDGVQWVENAIENLDIQQELEEDLKQIVEFRNQHRKLEASAIS